MLMHVIVYLWCSKHWHDTNRHPGIPTIITVLTLPIVNELSLFGCLPQFIHHPFASVMVKTPMPLVLAIDQDVSRILVAAHMRAFANAHWSHLAGWFKVSLFRSRWQIVCDLQIVCVVQRKKSCCGWNSCFGSLRDPTHCMEWHLCNYSFWMVWDPTCDHNLGDSWGRHT